MQSPWHVNNSFLFNEKFSFEIHHSNLDSNLISVFLLFLRHSILTAGKNWTSTHKNDEGLAQHEGKKQNQNQNRRINAKKCTIHPVVLKAFQFPVTRWLESKQRSTKRKLVNVGID
ncbi:hypothetical protein MGYG_04074 [Nannizzia gypsea CBS 118893]|uniref:Uncharacterized protein n=1 Tax=Arthroderma gypseum (strain ATCC MYA-4604 / CBS 118893) TaxID=535722 RepID=E4UUV4_ARTGP|nr:hypothetical protein MGYG_04074 [Nannizzia gypsea CBS 118893]EFR01071.1 hypothetical protein MGYG_04074 [Nannizzia gypsea CBS 118893]